MKKPINLFFIILFLLFYRGENVFSQNNLPSLKPEVEELKKISASIAAVERQKKSRILTGNIKEKKTNLLNIISDLGKEEEVIINKDTAFYWVNKDGKKLTIKYLNLDPNDFVVILLEEENKIKTGKVIYGKEKSYAIWGKITNLDKSNKKITISYESSNNSTLKNLEIFTDKNTNFFAVTKENDLIESKFTDLKIAAKLLIRGYYQEGKQNIFMAKRITVF